MPRRIPKWKSDEIVHHLEVFGTDESGRTTSYDTTYERGMDGSHVNIYLSNRDAEVKVVPYTLEHLKLRHGHRHPLELQELFAGIRDGTSIGYLGKYFTDSRTNGHRYVAQFFFAHDEPNGCNLGNFQGPEWSLARLPMITDQIRPHFETLKEFRPQAAQSIENCVKFLEMNNQQIATWEKRLKVARALA